MAEAFLSQKPKRFRIDSSLGAEIGRSVTDFLKTRGWTQTAGDQYELLWQARPVRVSEIADHPAGCFFNHLPGFMALTTKSRLAETVAAARTRLRGTQAAGAFRCLPETYILPQDLGRVRSAARRNPEALWIRKPVGSARGIGVNMVEDLEKMETGDGWLVQEYLARPHLLDGHKYTLRLYVLLTSVDPLLLYLFDEGFAKRASRPFSTAQEHLADRFRHLTNPDVLRDDPEVPTSALNLTLGQYRERLRAEGSDDEALWRRLRRLVWATVNAAREPMLAIGAPVRAECEGCFELFGFDVLIDENFDPWLLECNLSPSLAVEADADSGPARDEAEIKTRLVLECLELVGAGEGAPEPSGDPVDRAVQRAVDEDRKHGGFERLQPETIEDGWQLMALPRPSDLRVAKAFDSAVAPHCPRPRPTEDVVFHTLDDGVVVLGRGGELLHLNAIGGYTWLSCDEGDDPETIVRRLQLQFPNDTDRIRHEVFDAIGGWCHLGLLRDPTFLPVTEDNEDEADLEIKERVSLPRIGWNNEFIGRCLGLPFAVRCAEPETKARFDTLLLGFKDLEAAALNLVFDIERDDTEFVLRENGHEVVRATDTGELAAEMIRRIRTQAVKTRGGVAVVSGSVLSGTGTNAFYLGLGVGPAANAEGAGLEILPGPWIVHQDGRFEQIPGWRIGGPVVTIDHLMMAGDGAGEADLQPLPRPEALRRLVGEGLTGVPVLNADTLATLVRWLRSTQCFLVSDSWDFVL
ncbi:MAG: hypothetical protein DRJ61_11645 [Acidobacteria bacterium]|nr:MAG: hypothetical protein DRJ61_11645 [Acidobacteriota bacterium]